MHERLQRRPPALRLAVSRIRGDGAACSLCGARRSGRNTTSRSNTTRAPPGARHSVQKPQKLRHMLSQHGEIGRVYLAPEGKAPRPPARPRAAAAPPVAWRTRAAPP